MFDLKAFRNSLGVTQAQMAEAMGMPFRSYQDIEANKSPVRPVHVAAARWAAILLAADPADLLAPPTEPNAVMHKAIAAVKAGG